MAGKQRRRQGVFKSKTIVYRDTSGKKCRKDTPGARKEEIESEKWYGRYTTADGRRETVPLFTDKKESQNALEDLRSSARKGELNIGNKYREHRRKPLADHVADFEAYLPTKTPPIAPEHIKLTMQRIRDTFSVCKFTSTAQIDADKIAAYLAGLRAVPRSEGGLSIQSSNYYLGAVKHFCRWMVKRKRMQTDPLADLKRDDPTTDRRHCRRELSPAELLRILDAAFNSTKAFQGLTGTDRHYLYLTACGTGFRARELAHLTPDLFSLDGEPPTVTSPAKRTNNKRRAVQPLPRGIVPILRGYLDGRPGVERIWAGNWYQKAADMIQLDLDVAGVPYKVEGPDGPEFADFHALRHTYITMLSRSGVTAKQAQELARHSDIRLTLGTYTQAGLGDLGEAVNQVALPNAEAAVNPFDSLPRKTLEALAVLGIVLWELSFGSYTVCTNQDRLLSAPVGSCRDGQADVS